MINLRILMLLGLAALTVAYVPDEPDCSTCDYNDNIGYVKSASYCQVFYMCTKHPYYPGQYNSSLLCCDGGLDFNPAHLTCDWSYDTECIPASEHDLCPIVPAVGIFDCPYKSVGESGKDFESINNTNTNEVSSCAFGTVWDQYLCGCKTGAEYHKRDPDCSKILSFDFDKDFNSRACNSNFAAGVPKNDSIIAGNAAGNALCLDGHDDYLFIPYFNNLFAWNPIGHSFTLCFWFKQQTVTYGQGLFSTNCGDDGVSFIDIYLEDNKVKVAVSGTVIETDVAPIDTDFISVCVLFDDGKVNVYVNGELKGADMVDSYPINNQYAAALGYVHGYEDFKGYFDDFCFWTEANAQFAYNHYSDSYSNDNSYSAEEEGEVVD